MPTDIKPDLTKLVDQGPAKEEVGPEYKRNLKIVQGAECKSTNVKICKFSRHRAKKNSKLCKAQSAKVQMCESANLVDMDPSSRKNCKLCKAQSAKVQTCESANRVDMDPSSNAVCKLCNPTSISWPQLTSCKLSRLSVKEKI